MGATMPDSIDGQRVSRQQFLDRSGVSAALQQRLRALEQKAAIEQAKRVRAEQTAAGLRSAVIRLQAMVLDAKAKEAAIKARTYDADPAR
jgi:hypothetical protein